MPRNPFPLACCSLLLSILWACTDPAVPDYDYTTDFILVDGRIISEAGRSQVKVSRSGLQFGNFRLSPIENAGVVSVDDVGTEVAWVAQQEAGLYRAPADFIPVTGRSYFLRVSTNEGEIIESTPEVILPAVPVTDLRYRFEQEAYFDTELDRFVPAFTLLVDLDDPAGQDNFYQFTYRTWERTVICATCFGGVYRDGQCVEQRRVDYYDYACDEICWLIARNKGIAVLADVLTDGGPLRDVPAGQVVFTGSGPILAEVEVSSLSAPALEYLRQLRQLTDGAGGLNAPLPAPLYGNVRDLGPNKTNALGYVAAASVSSRRLYWGRDTVPGTPLRLARIPRYEPLVPSPPTAPCEGPNFTSERPIGWLN